MPSRHTSKPPGSSSSSNGPDLHLHSAAVNGNIGLVKYALKNGQSPNSELHGVLPIHAAASAGHEAVVKMLLDYGADVNAPRLPRRQTNDRSKAIPGLGTSGSTALHFAAANGHAHVVELLLSRGANTNAQEKRGLTPTMIAKQMGHDNIVNLLTMWNPKAQAEALSLYNGNDSPISPSTSTFPHPTSPATVHQFPTNYSSSSSSATTRKNSHSHSSQPETSLSSSSASAAVTKSAFLKPNLAQIKTSNLGNSSSSSSTIVSPGRTGNNSYGHAPQSPSASSASSIMSKSRPTRSVTDPPTSPETVSSPSYPQQQQNHHPRVLHPAVKNISSNDTSKSSRRPSLPSVFERAAHPASALKQAFGLAPSSSSSNLTSPASTSNFKHDLLRYTPSSSSLTAVPSNNASDLSLPQQQQQQHSHNHPYQNHGLYQSRKLSSKSSIAGIFKPSGGHGLGLGHQHQSSSLPQELILNQPISSSASSSGLRNFSSRRNNKKHRLMSPIDPIEGDDEDEYEDDYDEDAVVNSKLRNMTLSTSLSSEELSAPQDLPRRWALEDSASRATTPPIRNRSISNPSATTSGGSTGPPSSSVPTATNNNNTDQSYNGENVPTITQRTRPSMESLSASTKGKQSDLYSSSYSHNHHHQHHNFDNDTFESPIESPVDPTSSSLPTQTHLSSEQEDYYDNEASDSFPTHLNYAPRNGGTGTMTSNGKENSSNMNGILINGRSRADSAESTTSSSIYPSNDQYATLANATNPSSSSPFTKSYHHPSSTTSDGTKSARSANFTNVSQSPSSSASSFPISSQNTTTVSTGISTAPSSVVKIPSSSTNNAAPVKTSSPSPQHPRGVAPGTTTSADIQPSLSTKEETAAKAESSSTSSPPLPTLPPKDTNPPNNQSSVLTDSPKKVGKDIGSDKVDDNNVKNVNEENGRHRYGASSSTGGGDEDSSSSPTDAQLRRISYQLRAAEEEFLESQLLDNTKDGRSLAEKLAAYGENLSLERELQRKQRAISQGKVTSQTISPQLSNSTSATTVHAPHTPVPPPPQQETYHPKPHVREHYGSAIPKHPAYTWEKLDTTNLDGGHHHHHGSTHQHHNQNQNQNQNQRKNLQNLSPVLNASAASSSSLPSKPGHKSSNPLQGRPKHALPLAQSSYKDGPLDSRKLQSSTYKKTKMSSLGVSRDPTPSPLTSTAPDGSNSTYFPDPTRLAPPSPVSSTRPSSKPRKSSERVPQLSSSEKLTRVQSSETPYGKSSKGGGGTSSTGTESHENINNATIKGKRSASSPIRHRHAQSSPTNVHDQNYQSRRSSETARKLPTTTASSNTTTSATQSNHGGDFGPGGRFAYQHPNSLGASPSPLAALYETQGYRPSGSSFSLSSRKGKLSRFVHSLTGK